MKRLTLYGILAFLSIPTLAMADTGDTVGAVIGVVLGIIVVFLICRELICWYYKINEHSRMMKQILNELRAMNAANGVSIDVSGNDEPVSGHEPAPSSNNDEADQPDAWS